MGPMEWMPELATSDWLLLAAGMLLLCFGWLLYRAALTLSGALLGGLAGFGLGAVLPLAFGAEAEHQRLVELLLAAAGALAGALLFRWLHKWVFFLGGAGVGAWVAVVAIERLREVGEPVAYHPAVFFAGPAVVGLLAGIAAAVHSAAVVVVASCAGGSIMAMEALGWPGGGWAGAALFAVGLAAQAAILRRRADRDEDDE